MADELKNEEKNEFTDDELIEDVDPNDDAPVSILYRCKKCGQLLDANAKDCWKCSSKEIEQIVEEDTKDLRKTMLQSRIEKLEHDCKSLKKNNDILFVICVAVIIVLIVFFIANH